MVVIKYIKKLLLDYSIKKYVAENLDHPGIFDDTYLLFLDYGFSKDHIEKRILFYRNQSLFQKARDLKLKERKDLESLI
jgi:hypothetical protein